jgi:hypothetical protein
MVSLVCLVSRKGYHEMALVLGFGTFLRLLAALILSPRGEEIICYFLAQFL